MRRSIVWVPVLLVGSMVYWTLALGFGGLSLMSVTSDSIPCPEGDARDSFQSITVNLGDSLEGEGEGHHPPPGSLSVDLVSDHEGAGDVAGNDTAAVQSNLQGNWVDELSNDDRPERRGSGRRPRSDRGPGETAF